MASPTRGSATWGQTRVKGISGWRLAVGNTTEADTSCARRSQTPSRSVASGLFDVTRLEADLGAVDFAIDLVIAVDEADVLGLGAALERAGAAA